MEQIQELEAVIGEINSAFLRLSKISEDGYVPFDFKDRIEKLLFLMPNQNQYYINKVKALYCVFKDLLDEVSVEWSVLQEINDEDCSMSWTMYCRDKNRSINNSGDKSVNYEKNEFEKKKVSLQVGHETTPIKLTKLDKILKKVDTDSPENPLALRILESSLINQCIKLIEGAKFNFQRDLSLTFEKYLGWIDAALPSESILDDEIAVVTGDIKIKWNGGPAVLGYLMDELDRNGYQVLPYGKNNKRNAEFLLKIFNLNTSVRTLASELSENTNSLSDANKRINIKPLLKSRK